MMADKKQVSNNLKIAKGQIDGVLKMIEEDRYCIDISNQLLATEAIIKKANRQVLTAHIESCVKNALEDGTQDAKIEEVIKIIEKLLK